MKEGPNEGFQFNNPNAKGEWLWRKLQRVSGSIDRSPMFATPRSHKGEPCCGESLVINTLLINTVVWTPVHATAFTLKTSVVALPALLSEDEG